MNIRINTVEVNPGEETTIILNVAQLPTRTQIDIPITVFNSKNPGPTLLLMAGLHGDEINGIEILRRIFDHKMHHVNSGRVIIIPILNIYGFLNFSREVPDGKDVNRSFPGSNNGSLASKVAHMLMTEVVPQIDYGIDLHTGGGQINNYPQLRADFNIEKNRELAGYFQAPLYVQSNLIDKSLRWAAHQLGKQIIVFEGGESLRFSPFAIQEGINGILRLMKGLGMRDDAPEQPLDRIEIKDMRWIRCLESGLWILNCIEGQKITKGQLLGYTTSPFGDFQSEVYSPIDGYIIGLNYMSVVNRGDALIHIGTE